MFHQPKVGGDFILLSYHKKAQWGISGCHKPKKVKSVSGLQEISNENYQFSVPKLYDGIYRP